MDKKLNTLIQNIKNGFCQILADNLTGIYIHGSIAFGCFNWFNSDVDFIVAVEKEPSLEDKVKIIQLMLELDKTAPAKGLEMSVVLKQHCTEFVYPTPYCLHFSNSHKEKYKQDIMQHIQKMQGTDKDLAAHFTVINHYGITLRGEDKNTVFSPVPAEHYIDSIIFDIENAVEEIAGNPVYITLNLCRVLAYIKERKVLSKADGGIWGIKHLPLYGDIIKDVMDCYNSSAFVDFDNIRLAEMAENILKEISEKLSPI